MSRYDWRSTSDLPDDGDLVLGYSPESEESTEGYGLIFRKGDYLYEPKLDGDDEQLPLDYYTHYLELPKGPSEGAQ